LAGTPAAGADDGAEQPARPSLAASGTLPAPVPPPAPQQVAFDRGSLLVSRGAPAAAIPVSRMAGSRGRALLAWRIEEGSARAGRDFAGPLSGMLVLADGQERATVFIPLLDGRGATDDRDFSVVIDKVAGVAAKGEVARVDVTLHSFVREAPRKLSARD
jgi:hypothetical protein